MHTCTILHDVHVLAPLPRIRRLAVASPCTLSQLPGINHYCVARLAGWSSVTRRGIPPRANERTRTWQGANG
jgi:hypothetical protein